MEPSEASGLPLPSLDTSRDAWAALAPRRSQIDELVRIGRWDEATLEVDKVLLSSVIKLESHRQQTLKSALLRLRMRRVGRAQREQ